MPSNLLHPCLAALWTALLFSLLFTTSARAENQAYTVEGILLEKTASNAVEAKDLAIVEGQREAFETLAARLLAEVPQERISQMSDIEISTLISDFETNQEKFSSTRYQAKMTVRFNESAVKRVLSSYGKIDVARAAEEKLLILPMYKGDGAAVLWSENPWLTAWQAVPAHSGLVPLAVPQADMNDRALVSESLILTSGKGEMTYLLEKYNAKEILIPLATRTEQGVDVTLYAYIGTDLAELHTLSVPGEGVAQETAIWQAAVDAVKAFVNEDWKSRQKYTNQANDNQAELRIYFSDMRDWIETQRGLIAMSEISQMNVKSLKRDHAIVAAELTVPAENLQAMLAQNGYDMSLFRTASGYGATSLPAAYEIRKSNIPAYGAYNDNGAYNNNLNPQDSSVVYDTSSPDILPPTERMPDQPSLNQNTNIEGSYEYIYRPRQNYNEKRWDNTYERP